MEFTTIYNDLDYNGFPSFFLGWQLFNSRDYFEKGSTVKMKNQNQLHTDIGTLFHGSGLLGLSLYLILLIFIFRKVYKLVNISDLIFPLLPLLLSFILFSISGQYYVMTALSSFFIFLGFIASNNKKLRYSLSI